MCEAVIGAGGEASGAPPRPSLLLLIAWRFGKLPAIFGSVATGIGCSSSNARVYLPAQGSQAASPAIARSGTPQQGNCGMGLH
jgi:hypothetical protein